MSELSWPAKLFVAFFILTFASYGIGSGMVDAVTKDANYLANLEFTKTGLIVGAILMCVVHTTFNIGLSAIMFGVLGGYNRFAAAAYFGLAIIGTTMLSVGAIFLLLHLFIFVM